MTEPSWDALLTGIQAHASATAEHAGDLAGLAEMLRQTSRAVARGTFTPADLARWLDGQASVVEAIAGKEAAGLERITRLVADVRGESLDDTIPIDRGELAEAFTKDDPA